MTMSACVSLSCAGSHGPQWRPVCGVRAGYEVRCVRACAAVRAYVLSCVLVCPREGSVMHNYSGHANTSHKTEGKDLCAEAFTHACSNKDFLTSSHKRGSTFLPLCLPCAGGQAHTRTPQGVPRANLCRIRSTLLKSQRQWLPTRIL